MLRCICLFTWCCLTVAEPASADNVEETLKAYTSVALDVPGTTEAKVDFYRRWSADLFAAAVNNPDSPACTAALQHAVALSNGAGDFSVSVEICRNLVEKAPNNPRAWTEMGSVISTYANIEDVGPELKKEGIQCLETSNRLILNAEEQGTNNAYFREQYVINSSVIGSLASSLGEFELASQSYRNSRNFASDKQISPVGRMRGFSQETLAFREMKSHLSAGNSQAAEEVLEFLVAHCSRVEPVAYITGFADDAYDLNSDAYINALLKWCRTDAVSGRLLIRLGRAYFERDEWEDAVKVLTRADDDHAAELIEADAARLQQGVSGRYGGLLILLARSYTALKGYQEEELALWKRFLELHPNDERAEFAARRIEEITSNIPLDASASRLSAEPRSSSRALLAVNLGLAALALTALAVRRVRTRGTTK